MTTFFKKTQRGVSRIIKRTPLESRRNQIPKDIKKWNENRRNFNIESFLKKKKGSRLKENERTKNRI